MEVRATLYKEAIDRRMRNLRRKGWNWWKNTRGNLVPKCSEERSAKVKGFKLLETVLPSCEGERGGS